MAKQVGLFNLRGKIENKSFYKTAGVSETLIRQIPEGLSARVKTDEAYANTRLNNAEFKNANQIATVAFNSVNTRKRGMMRNFAIAAMTKAALEDIKQGAGNWGARVPATEMDTLICEMLEKHAKGGVYDGMFGVVSEVTLSNTGNYNVKIAVSTANMTQLSELGIDGFVVVPSKCLAGEILVDNLPRLFAGHSIGTPVDQEVDPTDDVDVVLSGSVDNPASVGMSPSGYEFAKEDTKHGFYLCATFLPYRTQGATRYTLQEYCTYVAIPLGQIPEE